MSTKIYNGYILHGFDNLYKLQQFLDGFKQKCREVAAECLLDVMASKVADIVDFQVFHKKEPYLFSIKFSAGYDKCKYGQDVFASVSRYIMEYRSYALQHPDEHVPFDFDMDIVIFPTEDNRFLATLYTAVPEFQEMWRSLPEVEFYGYWDNADQDEDCTEEQWEQRRADWGEVLLDKPCSVPSVCGFTTSLHGSYTWPPMVSLKDLDGHYPSFDERVEKLAKEMVMQSAIRKLAKTEKSPTRAFRQVCEWLNTDEGQKAFAKKKKHVAKKLASDVGEFLKQQRAAARAA